MITRFGMGSKNLGAVQYDASGQPEVYKNLSSETRNLIESEVKQLCEEAYQRADKLLKEKRNELELLANALLEYETVNKDEILLLLKGEKLDRVFPDDNTKK